VGVPDAFEEDVARDQVGNGGSIRICPQASLRFATVRGTGPPVALMSGSVGEGKAEEVFDFCEGQNDGVREALAQVFVQCRSEIGLLGDCCDGHQFRGSVPRQTSPAVNQIVTSFERVMLARRLFTQTHYRTAASMKC